MASTIVPAETLNLANLPADVIRKIFPMELESFNYLRLIAPRWNSLVLEHIAHSKNLPVIDRLHFFIKASGVRTLAIELPTVYVYSKGLTEHAFTVKCSKIMRQLVTRSK
ncbi:hypothetical protein PRIPAC_88876 [Pristionchus pacificus]|uniref:Uncharacterized protein n=1 Tax=Pristionchus pacificus TaxID=54126 RepID=A0A2A6B5N1_PRIPA|nr:hypothetical protein PRIPAC_88876 [Pristionchus pacificus]|eukprot:PDM61189.1 hypothetical protein PRIPAC_50631 [Pristionchus pacificus]